jgi:DNA-binding HxlR family transcriptional regulator
MAGKAMLKNAAAAGGPRKNLLRVWKVIAGEGGGMPDLDRLIHERLRLGIVSVLAVNEKLTFNELKDLLQTTDGNLSVHARKLEEAEYITCAKYFEGRMPKTEYHLTAAGRKALERYLNHMEALIHAARGKEGRGES